MSRSIVILFSTITVICLLFQRIDGKDVDISSISDEDVKVFPFEDIANRRAVDIAFENRSVIQTISLIILLVTQMVPYVVLIVLNVLLNNRTEVFKYMWHIFWAVTLHNTWPIILLRVFNFFSNKM